MLSQIFRDYTRGRSAGKLTKERGRKTANHKYKTMLVLTNNENSCHLLFTLIIEIRELT